MKVYTKRGDKGTSRLINNQCLEKDNLRFRVIGEIDELNSWLGLVRAFTEDRKLAKILQIRQTELFLIGAELAGMKKGKRISLKEVRRLEKEIDQWHKGLPRLENFVFPSGVRSAALLHLARTVCRRAEQNLVSLDQEEKMNKKILAYFNRLSDWLFVLARKVNQEKGVEEEEWKRK